jgi:hypothetical protein
MQKQKTLYLAGAISSDPLYEEKFALAATAIRRLDFAVMNPAVLPKSGFTHREYMKVTLAMLDVCEILCMLPDWHKSPGTIMEFFRAILTRKTIVMYTELIAHPDCIGGDPVGIIQALRALRRKPRPRRTM